MAQIKYLSNSEIDKRKWDSRIDTASNGLIYAYSFYLDNMARHWDALVMGDYETVMPLTWNRKYGYYYLYQPAFTASLGVFGNNLSGELINRFINAIPRKFRLIEISLNSANTITDLSFLRSNYILDLKNRYEELKAGYRENHKRNISKAFLLGCSISKQTDIDAVIELSNIQMRNISGTKPEDYMNFKPLYSILQKNGKAETYAVIDKNGQLLSSCVFFYSHNRAYYILVGNHPDGKTTGSSHALVDAFIKEHAGQDLILDFEGSDIRNLAFFYSGFGAREELYPAIRRNNLPAFIRWLKK